MKIEGLEIEDKQVSILSNKNLPDEQTLVLTAMRSLNKKF
jgi:hypothetical protein